MEGGELRISVIPPGELIFNIQVFSPHSRYDESEYLDIVSTSLFFKISPDDPTVQSLVESTLLESGVETITSGIRIQSNNAKNISLGRAKA